jgi:hypothetical protein
VYSPGVRLRILWYPASTEVRDGNVVARTGRLQDLLPLPAGHFQAVGIQQSYFACSEQREEAPNEPLLISEQTPD